MLLNRHEFTGLGVALSSFMAPLGASAIDAASGATSSSAERTISFRDGTVVAALGQGSARLGVGRHPKDVEEEALRTGVSLGMTLIDTSDDYSGGSIREIKWRRDCRSARPRISGLQTLSRSCNRNG